MDRARRFYIYAAAGIGLAALSSGLVPLVALAIDRLPFGSAGLSIAGFDARDELGRALALVMVGAPIWLLHWSWAGRGIRGDDPRAVGERTSATRALYLALVAAISLVATFAAAASVVGWVVDAPLGASRPWHHDGPETVARMLVAGGLWTYHRWVQAREARTPRSGAAAWLPRLYRYGATWAALVVGLVGVSMAAWVVLGRAVGVETLGDDDWWRSGLATAIPLIVVGGAAWLVHWREADRALDRDGAPHEDERLARLRATYFGAVTLLAVVMGCGALAAAVSVLARAALGVLDAVDPVTVLRDATTPVVGAASFLVAALLHQRRRFQELAPTSGAAAQASGRLGVRLVALVGLGFLATGAVHLLALRIEGFASGSPTLLGIGAAPEEMATSLSLLIPGMIAWIPAWALIRRWRTADPMAEARSTAGAVHLYVAVGVTLAAVVPSAVIVCHRAIVALLGGLETDALAAELAWPAAIILVGSVVAATHGRLIAVDRRLVAAAAGTVSPRTTVPVSIDLILRVDDPALVAQVVDRLRGSLGHGASLEVAAEVRADVVSRQPASSGSPA